MSTGSVVVNLPTTPTAVENSTIAVKIITISTTTAAYTLTINATGSDVFNFTGNSTTSFSPTILNETHLLHWSAAIPGWQVLDDSYPLTRTIPTVRQSVGPAAWTYSSTAMATWLNALGRSFDNGSISPAILMRYTDSFGSDFVNSWGGFDNAMYQKYNLYAQSPRGLSNINGGNGTVGYKWPTVTGTTLTTRGISGYAQQLTAGQTCTSSSYFTDGVLFMWLDDASTSIALQVDGSTVNTVSGTSKGTYYYAMPNGAGLHTVGYSNTDSGTATVDSVYFYLGNRSGSYQAWDVSHTGFKTSDYAGNSDTAYYLGLLQPAAVQFSTQTNDSSADQYRTDLNTMMATVTANVTVPPSIVVYSSYWARGKSNWLLYEAQAQAFCLTNNAALIDIYPIIGNIPAGSGADTPLAWTIDGTHPSARSINSVFGPTSMALYDIASIRGIQRMANGIAFSTAGTTYTVSGYERKIIFTSNTAVAVSIAQPITLAFGGAPIYSGQTIELIQGGTGLITVTATSGSLVSLGNSNFSTKGQYGRLMLTSYGISNWIVNNFALDEPRITVLTDAATIAVNADLTDEATVTLGGNRTMGVPSGTPEDGQKLLFRVRQDGTGSRTLAWNAIFHFGATVPTPTLSTAINKSDYIGFIYNAANTAWECVAVVLGY